jgi:outer membrane protein W
MKKTLLSMAMVTMGLVAFAQKPAAGDMTLESQFSMDLGGKNGWSTPNIRYRYFMDESMAIRAELLIKSQSSTQKIASTNVVTPAPNPAAETGEIKTSMFGFSLGIGAEKHLAGTEKLSPYFGAMLNFSSMGANNAEASGSNNGTTFTKKDDSFKEEGGGTTSFGLKLMFGADYYITSNVYLGGEMGWGFMYNSTAERTTSSKNAGVEGKTKVEANSGMTMDMMNFAATSVRFGIKF